MKISRLGVVLSSFVLCGAATGSSAPASDPSASSKATPLIVEKDEGERRVWRPIEGLNSKLGLFILKIDSHNGGSSHLVLGTEDLPTGGKIDTHRHPGSDEVLFLQNGVARVHVGDRVREVHAGATVFIPANTWISVSNIGADAIRMVFIFSAPGFEDFMRSESVHEGEKATTLSKAEDAEILKRHAHEVIYQQP